MKTIHCVLGALAAAFFATGEASATPIPVLPEGMTITADPASLLGFDASLNDYVPGGLSAVNDQNIEFLTDDFALGIDFGSDGLLRLWDNLGSGDDLFNYSLRFSFTGLEGLNHINYGDLGSVTSGDILFNVINGNSFELQLRDVQFAPGFSHADLMLAVDEPSMLALCVCGMGVMLLGHAVRRRRPGFVDAGLEP